MKKYLLFFPILLLLSGCQKDSSVVDSNNSQGKITASYKKVSVDNTAKAYQNGFSFVNVLSANVSPDGTSSSWQYNYSCCSSSNPVYGYFEANKNSVKMDSLSTFIPLGSAVIDQQWIDSDVALKVCEENGGADFRAAHSDYKITASLGKSDAPNSSPVWYISYASQKDKTNLIIDVSAETGTLKSKWLATF